MHKSKKWTIRYLNYRIFNALQSKLFSWRPSLV